MEIGAATSVSITPPADVLAGRSVAIVHDGLATAGGGGGAERVLAVLHSMFPTAPIYTTVYHPGRMPDAMHDWDIRTSLIQRMPRGRDKYAWYLPFFPAAIERLDLRGYDLVISCNHAVAKGVITDSHADHVCYCYSPMRFAWDMYHEYLEVEAIPNWQRRLLPLLMHHHRTWDALAASRVDQFVAISHYVKRRIEKYYRRPAAVIYPPVDCLKLEAPRADYHLVVSRLVAYKRIDLVVEAFNRLGWPLVIIGDGVERGRLMAMARDNIRFLGRQSDDVVQQHMAACRGFVFPGIEDFGIAPVEAMAAGRPVIALGRGGAAETVVDGVTGVQFAEQSVESLVVALERCADLVFDAHVIRDHAEHFSTQRFQTEFLAMLTARISGAAQQPGHPSAQPLERAQTCPF